MSDPNYHYRFFMQYSSITSIQLSSDVEPLVTSWQDAVWEKAFADFSTCGHHSLYSHKPRQPWCHAMAESRGTTILRVHGWWKYQEAVHGCSWRKLLWETSLYTRNPFTSEWCLSTSAHWHVGMDNFVWWKHILCTEGCYVAPLPSAHQIPITSPQLWQPKLP